MNPRAVGIFLLVALLVFVVAHAVVVVRIALVAKAVRATPAPRSGSRAQSLAEKMGPVRLLLAVFLPPLAPYYAWELGEGAFAVGWLATLAVYAIASTVS